jgi:hypothetical protein
MLVRTLTIGAVVAALAVALASSGSASGTKTLRFVDAQQTFTMDPKGPPAVGSRLIFTHLLYNRGGQFGKGSGARVGSAEVVCTEVSHARAQCTVTAHVPDGEIVAMGALQLRENGPTTSTFAILGGAGAYAGARGTVESRDISETRSLVTLHITG